MAVILASITPETIGGWALGIFVSTGVLWTLLMLMLRGFWEKTGKPVIKESMAAILSSPESVKARAEETITVVKAWHNDPEQIKSRTDLIEKTIDNAVNRTDGVIAKDTTQRLAVVALSTSATFGELKQELKEIKSSLKERSDEDRVRDSETSEKISRIEGGIEVLLKQHMKG